MRNRQWNRVVRYWPGGLAKKALTLSTEVERRGLPCRVTTLERTLKVGFFRERRQAALGVPRTVLEVSGTLPRSSR